MKVSVFDTYVKREDGKVMHFDILVNDQEKNLGKIHGFGKEYLQLKNQKSYTLTSEECKFCHIEEATAAVINDIQTKGYSIIEMENCND